MKNSISGTGIMIKLGLLLVIIASCACEPLHTDRETESDIMIIPESVQPAAFQNFAPPESTSKQADYENYASMKQLGSLLKDSMWMNLDNMILVAGGDYIMGSNEPQSNYFPPHRVRVNTFYIDQYEVTNYEYCQFLNSGISLPDDMDLWIYLNNKNCKIKKIDNKFIVSTHDAFKPVVCISWHGAQAYATWKGKRLPTEAEWEFAAKGGIFGRKSPEYAGSPLPDEIAWYRNNSNQTLQRVGLKLPNKLGVYDMSGNVWEWCYDYYQSDYYTERLSKKRIPQINPKGPSSGNSRTIRGGSWMGGRNTVKLTYRSHLNPDLGLEDVGFRCVKDFTQVD